MSKFNFGDTPKEITLNGATYVLKEGPKPEHEWKFGDIAHERKTGDVVFVISWDPVSETVVVARKAYGSPDYPVLVPEKSLTFLRRVDLSVPEKKDFKFGDKVYARRMYSLLPEKVTLLNKTDEGYNVEFEDGSVYYIHIDRLSANPF